jgi:ABC-type uncharacterized transport system permease subunit
MPSPRSGLTRLTGIPAPWNRPAAFILVGGLIAMLSVFLAVRLSTRQLVVGLLITMVWVAMGLLEALRLFAQTRRPPS